MIEKIITLDQYKNDDYSIEGLKEIRIGRHKKVTLIYEIL